MEQKKIKRSFVLATAIFLVCAVFHNIEVLIVRTDETFFCG